MAGSVFYGAMLGQQAADQHQALIEQQAIHENQLNQIRRQQAAAAAMSHTLAARPYQALPQTPMPGQPSVPMVHLPQRPIAPNQQGPASMIPAGAAPAAPQVPGVQPQAPDVPQPQVPQRQIAPTEALPSPSDPNGFQKLIGLMAQNGVTPDMPMWKTMMGAYEADRMNTLRGEIDAGRMTQAEARRKLEDERTKASQDSLDFQRRKSSNAIIQQANADPNVKAIKTSMLDIQNIRSLIEHGGPAATPQIQQALLGVISKVRATNQMLGLQAGFGKYYDRFANWANKMIYGEYTDKDKKMILQALDGVERDVLDPAMKRISKHAQNQIDVYWGSDKAPQLGQDIWGLDQMQYPSDSTIAPPHAPTGASALGVPGATPVDTSKMTTDQLVTHYLQGQ